MRGAQRLREREVGRERGVGRARLARVGGGGGGVGGGGGGAVDVDAGGAGRGEQLRRRACEREDVGGVRGVERVRG